MRRHDRPVVGDLRVEAVARTRTGPAAFDGASSRSGREREAHRLEPGRDIRRTMDAGQVGADRRGRDAVPVDTFQNGRP